MKREEQSRAYPLQKLGLPAKRGKAKVVVSADTHPKLGPRESEPSRPSSLPPNKRTRMSESDKVPVLSEQQDGGRDSDDEHAEHQFSTLADQLGIDEIDAVQDSSSPSQRSSGSSRRGNGGKYEMTTITLTQEQVETLVEMLDTTGEALKQLALCHNDTRPPRRPRIPVWITRYLFVITVVWQFMCIMALTVLDAYTTTHKEKKELLYILTIAILVLFQAVNLLLIFVTSVKLTKQFMHHTVTRSFLGQSYLSLTLLFAGLYTLVYKVDPSSFKDLGGLGLPDDFLRSVVLFIKMLFYAISIGTLCGAGHVVAAAWYAQMITALQMLMSYVYFASVLSIVLHPPKRLNYEITRDTSLKPPASRYGAINSV